MNEGHQLIRIGCSRYIISLALVLVSLGTNHIHASSRNDSKVMAPIVDSILKVTNLKYHDFWLADNYLPKDSYRLKGIDTLFGNPLGSTQLLNSIDDALKSFNYENAEQFYNYFSILNDLQLFPIQTINAQLPAKQINDVLGVDLDSAGNLATALVLKQYAALLVNTYNISFKNPAFEDFDIYKRLTQSFDSVLLELQISSSDDFFVSAKKEIEFRSSIKRFFEEAIVYKKSNTPMLGMALYKSLMELNSKNASLMKIWIDQLKTTVLQTNLGKIAIGGKGNDVYEGDFAMIIDFGGDDVYLCSNKDKSMAIRRPISIIIDYSGNDTYKSGDYGLAGTAFGISLLVDYLGDDKYLAGNVSLGSSVFGFALLNDLSGNDSYTSNSYTQGSAFLGIGLFIDKSGNDVYVSESYSQGFAGVGGFAILSDNSGNDNYLAKGGKIDNLRYEDRQICFSQGASLGSRPIASGGIGLLIDNAGNDTYKCDIFGQGSAYWFGLAALLDDSGNDKYIAHQYAQGSGVHFGFGFLFDYLGDDYYQSFGVSQGCGHDIALGTLLDFAGNDKYISESLSLGGGNANALSIFIDFKGNDAYITNNSSNTMGFSDFRRGFGMPAIFADTEGEDIYQDTVLNDTVSQKSSFGFFIDSDFYHVQNSKIDGNDSPKDDKVKPFGKNLDELFLEASASALDRQPYVISAIKEIAKAKESAFTILDGFIESQYPRERLAVEEIIFEMAQIDTKTIEKYLARKISEAKHPASSVALKQAGRLKLKNLENEITRQFSNNDWRIREAAASAYIDIEGSKYDSAFAQLIDDSNIIVRAKVAYSIGKKPVSDSLLLFKSLLKDPYFTVRFNAIQGLKDSKYISPEMILELIDTDLESKEMADLLEIFAGTKLSKGDNKKLKSIIIKLDTSIRKKLYEHLTTGNYHGKLLKELAKQEKDTELKSILKRKHKKED